MQNFFSNSRNVETNLRALYVVVQVVPEGVDEIYGIVSGIGIGVAWEENCENKKTTKSHSQNNPNNFNVSYIGCKEDWFHTALCLPKVMYPMLSPTAASVSLSSSGGSRWLNSTCGAVWLARRPSLNSYTDNSGSLALELDLTAIVSFL